MAGQWAADKWAGKWAEMVGHRWKEEVEAETVLTFFQKCLDPGK